MLSPETESCLLETFLKSDGGAEWSLAHVSSADQMAGFIEQMIRDMRSLRFSDRDLFATRLAVEEALVNALKHGHGFNTSEAVTIRYSLTSDRIIIEVEDQGPGFQPSEVPDPTLAENLERSSGRGILLMRSFMNMVRFNERGNRVTLCKFSSARRSQAN